MITDYIREMLKESGEQKEITEAQKEVSELSNKIYNSLQKGTFKKGNREAIIRLVSAINPDLSPTDSVLAGTCIELICIATLSTFLSEGTIIREK